MTMEADRESQYAEEFFQKTKDTAEFGRQPLMPRKRRREKWK